MYLISQKYQKNIFINCPFDHKYNEIFNAIIFAILDCGYIPRCALEIADSAKNRLEKIFNLIELCQFGIHDLSRTSLDEEHQLPRFNMPFELGLFLGASYFGNKEQKSKSCLILDSEPYRFQKFISDIAGNDIYAHKNNFQQAQKIVTNWLQSQTEDNIIKLTGHNILTHYQNFQSDISLMSKKWEQSLEDLPFTTYCYLTKSWIEQNSNPSQNPPH